MITDDTDVSAASPASRARARFIEVILNLINTMIYSDLVVLVGLPAVGNLRLRNCC